MAQQSDGCILALDIGTTGAKTSAFSFRGELLASHYDAYATRFPQEGWVEQDPQDWRSAFCRGTHAALQLAALSAAQVSAVVVSGHMHGCVPVDPNGQPLTSQAMLWADRRSFAEAAEIIDRVGWPEFYQITGGGLEMALYPIAKLRWMKRHNPELYRRAYKFLGTKDTLLSWMTGDFVTDPSDASDTGMLDIDRREWATALVTAAGLSTDKLPRIVDSATVLGPMRADAARSAGLRSGIPVVVGCGDVACSAIGAGALAEGAAYNYIGSASWVAVASSRPLREPVLRPFVLCHAAPDMYISQLATYSAGIVFEWVRDQLCFPDGNCPRGGGFDVMTQRAAESPIGANGLTFLPFLRPGGAPNYDLNDRGLIYGLTISHTQSDLLRAAIEGISCSIRQLVEGLESCLGRAVEDFRVIGGAAKSELWLSILANLLSRPVRTLNVQQEANTLGAAVVAAVAVGHAASYEEAANRFLRLGSLRKPNSADADAYLPVYARFLAISDEMRRCRGAVRESLEHRAGEKRTEATGERKAE